MFRMIKTTLAFSLGAAAGVAASYFYWKSHFERWAQDEINTMREYFGEKLEQEESQQSDALKEIENKESVVKDTRKENIVPEMMEYAKKVSSSGYTNYSEKNLEQGDEDMFEKPYAISPDEFGELPDYDCVSLSYYSNGILADDMDEVVDDVDEVVGSGFAKYFGEYEDDVAYIRNDRLRCDYEILKNIDPY